jgi:hypothetical protein
VATVLAIAAVIGMTRLAFVVGRGPHPVSIAAAALEPSAEGNAGGLGAPASGGGVVRPGHYAHNPVLEIRGFGSSCCQVASLMKWVAPGAKLQQFSYLGMTSAGRPLPHGSAASDLPLPELGDRIAAQVLRLHQETGRPVDIIAESEGTLGVDAMLATHHGLPLGSVVMMSPIVAPDRVTYQPGTGAGLVPANELRAVVWFVGGLSPFGSSGAQTLISSVDAVGAQYAATAARHHPLRWMVLVPLADAVTLPVCPLPRDVYIVPALHGDLIGTPMVDRMVRSFLAHETVQQPGRYKATAELVAAAAAAWRMPETAAPAPACGK